jgi:hypothetical protein
VRVSLALVRMGTTAGGGSAAKRVRRCCSEFVSAAEVHRKRLCVRVHKVGRYAVTGIVWLGGQGEGSAKLTGISIGISSDKGGRRSQCPIISSLGGVRLLFSQDPETKQFSECDRRFETREQLHFDLEGSDVQCWMLDNNGRVLCYYMSGGVRNKL